MIVVRNLTKSFASHAVLNAVTFTVNYGEIFGIYGPDGAGKTTLMRVMATCLLPTSGSVLVMGNDTVTESLGARRCIGYLPEDVRLYSEMKVGSFLRFAAAAKGVKNKFIEAQVQGTLRDLDLEEVGGRLIGKLSQGHRKRVGLAQALIGDPAVLLLDMPTLGLDPGHAEAAGGLISDLSGWRTIVLTSSDPSELNRICNRVAVMDRGRILDVGEPSSLAEKYGRNLCAFKVVEGHGEAMKVPEEEK